jgi:hypothetical protein
MAIGPFPSQVFVLLSRADFKSMLLPHAGHDDSAEPSSTISIGL